MNSFSSARSAASHSSRSDLVLRHPGLLPPLTISRPAADFRDRTKSCDLQACYFQFASEFASPRLLAPALLVEVPLRWGERLKRLETASCEYQQLVIRGVDGHVDAVGNGETNRRPKSGVELASETTQRRGLAHGSISLVLEPAKSAPASGDQRGEPRAQSLAPATAARVASQCRFSVAPGGRERRRRDAGGLPGSTFSPSAFQLRCKPLPAGRPALSCCQHFLLIRSLRAAACASVRERHQATQADSLWA